MGVILTTGSKSWDDPPSTVVYIYIYIYIYAWGDGKVVEAECAESHLTSGSAEHQMLGDQKIENEETNDSRDASF